MGRVSSLAVGVLLVVPSDARVQQFAEVTITGNDYAYINSPAALHAGMTAFSLVNKGTVPHELILLRPKPGVSPDSVARSWASGTARRETTEMPEGVVMAVPGLRSAGRLLVNLERGKTYMLICNFQDMPDKPRHVALGMFTSFQVK